MKACPWRSIAIAALVLTAISCGAPGSKPVVSPVVATPAPGVLPFEDVTFISPNEGWALILNETTQAVEVAHSVDGGATWSTPAKVAPFRMTEGEGVSHFGVRFTSSRVGWVFGQGIFATADGGQTWIDTGVTANVLDLATVGEVVWAITGCDPRFSSCPVSFLVWDGTAHRWNPMRHQPPVTSGPLHLIPTSARRAFVVQGTQFDTRLVQTDDGGVTWSTLATPCPHGIGLNVATLDGAHLWMVCSGEPGAGNQEKAVFTSSDGGGTWSLRARDRWAVAVGTITTAGYTQDVALASSTTGFHDDEPGRPVPQHRWRRHLGRVRYQRG